MVLGLAENPWVGKKSPKFGKIPEIYAAFVDVLRNLGVEENSP